MTDILDVPTLPEPDEPVSDEHDEHDEPQADETDADASDELPALDAPCDLRPTFADDPNTPVFAEVCAHLRDLVPTLLAELHDDGDD